MSMIDDILNLCPPSDAVQRALLRRRYGLTRIEDLQDCVIFGAARLGASLTRTLKAKGVRISAFSDNDATRWGIRYEGLPLIAPADIDHNRPIIVASKFVRDICPKIRINDVRLPIPHYLLPLLLPEDLPPAYHCLSADTISFFTQRIREAFALLEDAPSRELFLTLLKFRITLDPFDLPTPVANQYFPGDFWLLNPHEAFVDVGACGGDTLADFLRHTGGSFAKYFAIEPDPRNLAKLRRAIPAHLAAQVLVLPYGAGELRQRRVPFVLAEAGGESRVGIDGDQIDIEVVPLDELLATERVTTIKIDVEGFEPQVLRGARQVIVNQKPKLAISVYHKLPDLWELALWVRDCRPGYRYYLRHHTAEIYDTVLYCVPGR